MIDFQCSKRPSRLNGEKSHVKHTMNHECYVHCNNEKGITKSVFCAFNLTYNNRKLTRSLCFYLAQDDNTCSLYQFKKILKGFLFLQVVLHLVGC